MLPASKINGAHHSEEELLARIAELEARLALAEATAHDATDQQRILSEEHRRSAELTARMASIIENTSDCVGMADAQGFARYLNRAGLQMFGVSPGTDLATVHVSQFVPERLRPAFGEEILGAVMRDGHWSGETTCCTLDGREFPVSQVVMGHRNAAGELEYISTIIRDTSDTRQLRDAMADSEQRLHRFLDALPVGVFVVDVAGRPFYANRVAQELLGKGIVPSTGMDQLAEVYAAYVAGTREPYPTERMPLIKALHGERAKIDDMEIHQPSRVVPLEIEGAPIYGLDGQIAYALTAFTDISERRAAAEALRLSAQQEAVISAQAAALQELSTPLLSISEKAVVMPLVGAIDSSRAQQVLETLLGGVAEHRSNVAIIDITGVSIVDTQVANALVRAAQAVRLLGAQVVLTGIRPEIAQTLVGLGVDLSGIITRSTLRNGITYAMEHS